MRPPTGTFVIVSPRSSHLLLISISPLWLFGQYDEDCLRHDGPAASAPAASAAAAPTGDALSVEALATLTAEASLAAHRRAALSKLVDGPAAVLDSQAIFGVRYFPYDSTLAFTALFRPGSDTALVNFPTSDGRARAYRAYGQLVLLYAGAAHALEVYEIPGLRTHPVYGDLLFLPFFDASNDETTYGGGRYLDLSRAAFETGDYRVDFNRAYNPYCAYADGFSCPIPPRPNHLRIAVPVGEKWSEHFRDGH